MFSRHPQIILAALRRCGPANGSSQRRRPAAVGPAALAEHGLGRDGPARRRSTPRRGKNVKWSVRWARESLRHAGRRRRPGAHRHEQRRAARPAAPGRPRRADVPRTRPTAASAGNSSCPSSKATSISTGRRRASARRPRSKATASTWSPTATRCLPRPGRAWPTATTARSATKAATWPRDGQPPIEVGPHRRRHPLAVRPADRRGRAPARLGPRLDPARRAVPLPQHVQRPGQHARRRATSPTAPSLIVLDKATGRLVAQDDERIGPRIFHCTWSSPALGEVGGRRLVFFGGGDGVCYAFEPCPSRRPPATGAERCERVWRFDCDPTAPKENVHRYISNRKESPSNIKSMPVFHDGRVYVTVGGDIWWGKHQAWLKCIDATRDRRHHGRRPGLVLSARAPLLLDARDRTTAWSTWPIAAARSTASTPRPASPIGSTTPAARSGARRWWPTARSTSARAAGDFWILAAGKEKTRAQLDPPRRPDQQHARGRQRHALRRHA